jgi:hypothetical protein
VTGTALHGRVLSGTYGQLATLILILQLLRLLDVSLIRCWVVWSTLAFIQLALAALLVTASAEVAVAEGQGGWLAGLSSVLSATGLSMACCLALAWYLRKIAPDGSPFFDSLPPMASTQEWLVRAVTYTLPVVLISPLAHLMDARSRAGSLLPVVLPVLAAILTLYSANRYRKSGDVRGMALPNAVAVVAFLLSLGSIAAFSALAGGQP